MATNYVTAKYQEIVDVSTVNNTVSLIGIHTPVGRKPYNMLSGFFNQFKRYRYVGCDVVCQPAATLPADPLSVSYEAGDTATDPRDLLNPIIFKGCHGENMNAALNSMYRNKGFDFRSNSLDKTDITFYESTNQGGEADGMYYSALSDVSFKKYNVLQPFRINGLHPLVHDLVSTSPLPLSVANASDYSTDQSLGEALPFLQNGGDVNTDTLDSSSTLGPTGTIAFRHNYAQQVWDGDVFSGVTPGRSPVNSGMFTNRMKPLGWMDTHANPTAYWDLEMSYLNGDLDLTNERLRNANAIPQLQTLPKLFMGCLVLPPSFKSILTFRFIFTHKFEFKDFGTAQNYNLVNGFAGSPDVAYWSNLPTTPTMVATASELTVTDPNAMLMDYDAGSSLDGVSADQTEVTAGVY